MTRPGRSQPEPSPAPPAEPDAALNGLLQRLDPVEAEAVAWAACAGRVLAEPVLADRDSPACDVSAMDGYAVRRADLAVDPLPVEGEAVIGQPASALPPGRAMRIFTGGPVPAEADAVIRREDTDESPESIRLWIARDQVVHGQNIRRRGENVSAGATVLEPGAVLTPAAVAAVATFGLAHPRVHRRLRVSLITTGDELRNVEEAVSPTQVRNANGPALAAMVSRIAWAHLVSIAHVIDQRQRIDAALHEALADSDAVLLTGGVSMGDHDHVPDAVRHVGAKVVFHRLPIRPGKPILGAVGPQGQAILGLPGNPVSVLVTARRFALPALARRAGLARLPLADARVTLVNHDDRTLQLTWHRPVRRIDAGRAELIPNRGSGDVAATAASDGFVEVPRGQAGAGPFPFYRWDVA